MINSRHENAEKKSENSERRIAGSSLMALDWRAVNAPDEEEILGAPLTAIHK